MKIKNNNRITVKWYDDNPPNKSGYVYNDIGDENRNHSSLKKLGQFEDIEEEELGIGFDLFIRILKAKRIWYKDAFIDVTNGRSQTTRILAEEWCPYAYYDDSHGLFMISVANKTFFLNRYGIDYALTKEELE